MRGPEDEVDDEIAETEREESEERERQDKREDEWNNPLKDRDKLPDWMGS